MCPRLSTPFLKEYNQGCKPFYEFQESMASQTTDGGRLDWTADCWSRSPSGRGAAPWFVTFGSQDNRRARPSRGGALAPGAETSDQRGQQAWYVSKWLRVFTSKGPAELNQYTDRPLYFRTPLSAGGFFM